MVKQRTIVIIFLIVYSPLLAIFYFLNIYIGFLPAIAAIFFFVFSFFRGSSKIYADLSDYELKWSKHWNKKNITILDLDNSNKLNKFLEHPESWKSFMENMEGFKNASKWSQEAFMSISTCSKGLIQEARFLDHALISVPPPLSLFKSIDASLNDQFVVGIEAPSGWGKSRLALWVAFSQAINGKKIFYFPNPNRFLNERYQNSLLRILNKKNKVIIIDDFLRRDDSTEFEAFMEDFFIKAKNNKNLVLLLKTTAADSQEKRYKKTLLDGVHVISLNEHLWRHEWVERFFRWFEILCTSNFIELKNFLHTDYLVLARNTESPCAFVSVMVNLKDLIGRQFDLPKSLNKLVMLTLIYFGFAVSNEIGITPEEMYEGLVWVKDNKEEIWTVLEKTGGNLWTFINNNDKEGFLENLELQVNKWRDQPNSPKDIRLLPSEGVPFGPKVPIQAHHIVWWRVTLKDLWNNKWREYRRVKDACELVIVHACYNIDGSELTLDKKCSILQDCTQIKILNLAATDISSIAVLDACSNLEELNLSFTKVDNIGPLGNCLDLKVLILKGLVITDISPLDNLRKLKYLDISDSSVVDISPLETCPKLEYLDIGNSSVLDISPLETCPNLKYLNLSGSVFLYDLLNGVFDESQTKEYTQFIERLKHKGVKIETEQIWSAFRF